MKSKRIVVLVVLLSILVATPKGFAEQAIGVPRFKDFSENHDRYEDIYIMAGLGIMNGDHDGYFEPDKELSRAEFAVILNRLDNLGLSFEHIDQDNIYIEDIEPNEWWYEDIFNVVNKGLMKLHDNRFNPNDKITGEDLEIIHGENEINDDLSRASVAGELVKYLDYHEIDTSLPNIESLDKLLVQPITNLDIERLLGEQYKVKGEITLRNLADKITDNIELTYDNYEYYRSELKGVSNRNILKCYSEGIFERDLVERYKTSGKNLNFGDLLKLRDNMNKPIYPARPEYILYKDIPVLMYHEIGALPKGGSGGLYVHPDTYMSHLDSLNKKGYNTITMDQLYNHWENNLPIPSKPIVITFDDGYDSHYTFAPDELSKRGMTGTFYMVTGNIGSNDIKTGENLKRIYQDGIEIGSHTVYHIDSSSVDKERLIFEYEGSKKVLERFLGEEITSMAYPFGIYTPYAQELLDELGYKTSVTTRYALANKNQGYLSLSRIRVEYTDTANNLLRKISGK